MKPIIVTGGAGFIGSHLVERLLADGKSVVVIDDLSTGNLANLEAVKTHPRLRVIESRVSDCGELTALVSQAESIYHLAAAVGVELVLNSPLRSIQSGRIRRACGVPPTYRGSPDGVGRGRSRGSGWPGRCFGVGA